MWWLTEVLPFWGLGAVGVAIVARRLAAIERREGR
jgi:hypothetical protein